MGKTLTASARADIKSRPRKSQSERAIREKKRIDTAGARATRNELKRLGLKNDPWA